MNDVAFVKLIDYCRLYELIEPLEPLRPGRSILNLPGLAQGVYRFVDCKEDYRFKRAKCAAASNRQRNRGHRHVVRGLPIDCSCRECRRHTRIRGASHRPTRCTTEQPFGGRLGCGSFWPKSPECS